ncbi:ATP-binding protein [Haloarcula halophila]|uniref:ATP-binding protein n=1 Tax=Haloarcula TaxID=2237 RepID=UPI0023E3D26F|nr:ATP-binding protein [Halomicroarcula sp. DFY41]
MAESKTWTPREGHDWGTGTQQGRAILDDEDDAPDWWTDGYEMRMRFGIPEFDAEAFDFEVYPDCLVHEKPADKTKSAGGTDWLKIGERGCGKSTDNLHWTIRLLEENGPKGEQVVWRGSPERSEWLPLREWATLWLPEHADPDPSWESEGEQFVADDADLDEVVRSVETYADPADLLAQLEAHPSGTFNVVYPDPSFAGCEELTADTNRVAETLPFVPEWRTMGDETGTPLSHWWYAFMLACVEARPTYSWLSVIFDEAGDLTPEDAEDDEHRTFKKLSLLRSVYADSRRAKLSIYWSAHYEENLHHKIRREVMWRVDMPDETPNPRTSYRNSVPVGYGTVPMHTDVMSSRKVGTALMYNQKEFTLYRWKDIPQLDADEGRWLQLELGEPDTEDDDQETGPTLQYDSAIFSRWRKGDEDRLYVKDPGDGYLDVQTGQEVDALASPKDGLTFGGIEPTEEYYLVRMRDESGEETIVAKLPKQEIGLGDGVDGAGREVEG